MARKRILHEGGPAPAPEAAGGPAPASSACVLCEEAGEDIPFTPVPVRTRRDGWTPERQRAFIRALAQTGSVSTAARTVGKTRRSAYNLLERPGTESLAAAWDMAAEHGFHNLHDHSIERALHGAVVPRFYKGRQTGVVHRYYDAVAIAVLSGRGASLSQRLREAEERGIRKAYFDIERAWRRDKQDLVKEQERRIAAEEKLARLAAAGLIGLEWLDPGNPNPPLADAPPPGPALPPPLEAPPPPGPRIRRL